MGPPASHSALSISTEGEKRQALCFLPPAPHVLSLCLSKDAPETRLSHFKQVSGKWELAISNLPPPPPVKEHLVLAALLWWKRPLGPEQRLPVCGREAQHDAELERGGPGWLVLSLIQWPWKVNFSWHSFAVHCFYSPVLSGHRTTFNFTSVISQPQTAEI